MVGLAGGSGASSGLIASIEQHQPFSAIVIHDCRYSEKEWPYGKAIEIKIGLFPVA